MKLYPINPRVLLRNVSLIILFAVTFISIFLLINCVGSDSDSNGSISALSDRSAADSNSIVEDGNGPTLIMSYRKEKFVKNPIESFMYFVPLIAPTLVDNISSVNNDQQVGIISHDIKVDSKSFQVACEFEILGNGFHMNTFDPNGMIEAHTDDLKKGETLTHMLDYIKVEGDGYGIIEAKGTIAGSTYTVTEVDMQFNARGHKSPVTIGLYDIEPKDGEYKYENRSNEIVARVNTLAFKKTEQTPKMGIEIASIAKKGKSAGLFGWIKGAIANLLIKPLKVTKLGNITMLEFGEALFQEKTTFTFPKATNIKENKVVEIDPKQK
ncbi:MAG: hypothetical protein P8016_08925 [Sedimentisphaerales bacterium]|jgi:hypothetical protein